MAELGPVVDAMFMALLQMDLFYASCAAACRCMNHQMEVAEEYYNNNKHMAVNPTAEVKAGTERLFQLNDEWKRWAYRDVKDQFGVDPRSRPSWWSRRRYKSPWLCNLTSFNSWDSSSPLGCVTAAMRKAYAAARIAEWG
ncbi:hypothetical protein PLESTF_000484400 [Pleodorina starrii]|nr:hypothetical protein PLESTM_000567900 [Pleodorina starrii]GLC66863.1 hypothetical protein PLESTF_000484400 [Pleodorina starrii]